jgi:hypothetical protein
MGREYQLDENGCRLLSSRQWKQLRERVFLRPGETGAQLLEHYSQQPVNYRTGKLAFEPTEAEWNEAIKRSIAKQRRFV